MTPHVHRFRQELLYHYKARNVIKTVRQLNSVMNINHMVYPIYLIKLLQLYRSIHSPLKAGQIFATYNCINC